MVCKWVFWGEWLEDFICALGTFQGDNNSHCIRVVAQKEEPGYRVRGKCDDRKKLHRSNIQAARWSGPQESFRGDSFLLVSAHDAAPSVLIWGKKHDREPLIGKGWQHPSEKSTEMHAIYFWDNHCECDMWVSFLLIDTLSHLNSNSKFEFEFTHVFKPRWLNPDKGCPRWSWNSFQSAHSLISIEESEVG